MKRISVHTPIARLREDFEHAHVDVRLAVYAHREGNSERITLHGARIALQAHPEYRPELERQSVLNADRMFNSVMNAFR